jgi:hypothetical protein
MLSATCNELVLGPQINYTLSTGEFKIQTKDVETPE